MTYDNHFHIAFYCAAIFVSLTTVVFTKLQRRVDKTQNRLFLLMNYIVLVNALTSVICAVVEPYRFVSDHAYSILLVFQFFYFFFHTMLAPSLFFYVLSVTGYFSRSSTLRKTLYSIPLFITEFFVIINPFFHLVYYYDSHKNFNRNWAELLIYFAAGLYFMVSMGFLLFSWNALTRRKRHALLYFFVIAIGGVIIQFVEINIKSELFAEALALLGLMLSVESEDARLDSDTGFYNRSALRADVNYLLAKKHMFYAVCLKIANTETIQRVTGSPNADFVSDIVAEYIRTIIPRYYVYRTDPGTMLLLLTDDTYPRGEADALAMADKIDKRFKNDFLLHGVPIKLSATIMVASVPKNIQTLKALFYMVDTPIPADIEKTILVDDDLGFLIRRAEVESAIHRGLKENGFEVYYQPTYCADDLSLHGAEALIRLNDPVLGKLFPDEFIPVAEQTGSIGAIDDFVLREVCEFLKTGEPTRWGMDCINVNLSVLQCMQDNFVEHIISIVESYDIPKSLINFEITESVSASDYRILSDVVGALKKNGFQFSMDDYGTGYSNMHSLFSLAFDIVKIDKSILWDSEESSLGEIILENCVHMIRQMGRKVLVEGVETKEHADKLKNLGVDYLQGFYFSRPITKNEFLQLIS